MSGSFCYTDSWEYNNNDPFKNKMFKKLMIDAKKISKTNKIFIKYLNKTRYSKISFWRTDLFINTISQQIMFFEFDSLKSLMREQ